MRFAKHYTVKWHDTGADRVVSPSRILGFMQETASLHCSSLGHDLDEMRERDHLGFVVTRFSYESLVPLLSQDEITVETWVPEGTGLFFGRCYEIKRNGVLAARGLSVSVLLSLDTRKFLRVSDYDFGFEYEPTVTLSDGLPTRLRLASDQPLAAVGTRTIAFSDCDYNLHMNNTRYADMLADLLPERAARRIASMAISYVSEARLGDTLSASVGLKKDATDSDTFCIRLTRADGAVVTEAEIVAPTL